MGPTPQASEASLKATDRPQRLGDKILFVNFEGGDMNFCGNNDPANNCSTIFQGTVLPFTGNSGHRASIIQVVRSRMADFGVTVTDQRPQSGDYDMEMVGDWENQDPPFAGVAPNIDCFDSTGGETSFTLEASGSTDGMAEIILQELAHTWGLEHINDQSDLLYPTTQGSGKTFRDECIKIVSDTDLNETNGQCNQVHTQFCDFGWQNSYQEMLFLFGQSLPDTISPTVDIVTPEDGATIEGDFDLVISLVDDQSPAVINTTIVLDSDSLPEPLEVDGAYAAPNDLPFPISDLPDGDYTVSVNVTDESDNPASDMSTFTIIGNPPMGGSDGGESDGVDGGSGDEAGDGTGGGGETDGVSSLGIPPTTPEQGGCDCRSGAPEPREGLALGLLALLGLRRRRR